MDIPIDDSDTFRAVTPLRMTGRNRNIVEKAKAHRSGKLGMMSRRAGCNEHVVCCTGKDIIDRRRRRTNRCQRCIQTFRADIGVAIKLHHGRWRFLVRSRLRYSGAYGFQMFFRMGKQH